MTPITYLFILYNNIVFFVCAGQERVHSYGGRVEIVPGEKQKYVACTIRPCASVAANRNR